MSEFLGYFLLIAVPVFTLAIWIWSHLQRQADRKRFHRKGRR